MVQVKNVLVPIDFEETSALALVYARELASRFKATLTLVHVADDEFALSGGTEGRVSSFPELEADRKACTRTELERLMTADDHRSGARAVVLISSLPAEAIVEYARSSAVDLIVMGTHGRGRAPADAVGSVAERVVRSAPCPVLTVGRAARNWLARESTDETVAIPHIK